MDVRVGSVANRNGRPRVMSAFPLIATELQTSQVVWLVP